MGFFDTLFTAKHDTPISTVTFTLDNAAHTYEDGNIGLDATTLTITPSDRRVAVIGLNGSGKTTLLKLLDGALPATAGSVRITADGTDYDPSVKRDLKHVEDCIGRVRREEIPNGYYQASSIREAIDQPLKNIRFRKANVRRSSAICSLISTWHRSRRNPLPPWMARNGICWRSLPR